MDRLIIDTCKDYINTDQLEELQRYVTYILTNETLDYRLPMEYIYQHVYLHACLRKNEPIAVWIKSIFPTIFNDVQQIALRQMFAYGNYLLCKK